MVEYLRNSFTNASRAFTFYYNLINAQGAEHRDTRRLLNVGFYITDPENRSIDIDFRKWNKNYAEREWQWYLSENRSVSELKKFAPIWDKMHKGDDIVNSNYGWQWGRNNQLDKVIELIKTKSDTRQAWISIYDGKEIEEYKWDSPCTIGVGFMIVDRKLCMNVLMRSNDLWYGFCNDQYCFSKLQRYVADSLGFEVGWYYHHAVDMHLYQEHFIENIFKGQNNQSY